MAVTATYTQVGYGSGNITATLPSGTGGILLAVVMFHSGDPVPSTPADWTYLDGESSWGDADSKVYWALASDTPDLVFTRGAGEAGVGIIRISDADTSSPTFATANYGSGTWYTTDDIPDVASAPAGTAIAVLGMRDNSTGATSTSKGLTDLYTGDIGSEGWYAAFVSLMYEEGVSAGTWDGGTVTSSGDDFLAQFVSVVVKTGGGGGPTSHPITASGSTITTGSSALDLIVASTIPQNLIATTFDDDRIDLTWDAVASAVRYVVERDDGGWHVINGNVATTSYSDTGLAPSTLYNYRVRSVV
jgi:hypothetical protein